MKKILMGAALLAMGLQGCQEEEIISAQDNIFKIEATKALNTRTTTDEEGNVYWSQGDKLLVFGPNGSWGTLTLEAEDAGKPEGTFSGMIIGEPKDLKYAVYGNAARNFNTVTIDYTGYTYPNSNSPMKGIISNGKVGMEHLYGMVRLEILNFPKTESTLVLKGNGIAGTAVWNGVTFNAESSSDEITVKIPAGKREATMIIDVPVFVSASTVNLSVELNGIPYKKAGATASSTSIKTNLKVGALNVSNMPKMEVKGNELTDATTWSEDVESGDELTSDENVYLIKTAEDLATFASMVNGGETFEGKTVKLGANIDLLDKEWTPIGTSSISFQGTFDGDNHKISNLNINGGKKSNQGLFGYTTVGEIKNLVVENAKVTGRLNVGVVAGTPYTSKYTNITVKGVVEVNGFAYVGGVGGKNAYANWTDVTVDVEEGSYVKANSVENGTAYRTYVGGVVGFNGEGGHSFTNIKSNIDVYGTTCDVGGLFGIAHYGNQFVNCSSSGHVEITNAGEASDAEEMGGIAGVWHNGGSDVVLFTGCSFTGTLKANITDGVDLTDNTIVGNAYYPLGYHYDKEIGENVNDDGKLVIDEVVLMYVSTSDRIAEAITNGAQVIKLSAGTYIIPDEAKGQTLTFIGIDNAADTKIATQDDGSYEECDYSLDGSTVTFENISINTDSHTYTGYARCNGTYKKCIINGTYTLYGNSIFEDCIFNVSGDVYNIWTWGAINATFTGCTFNSDGKALLLYSTVNTKLTINDCTFNDNGGLTDLKAAIEIGDDYGNSYELIVNNTTVNGYEINDKGINTGTTLWANKNSMPKDKLNVVVDGVDVY